VIKKSYINCFKQSGICGVNQWGEVVSWGLGDGSLPVGFRGEAPVGDLGEAEAFWQYANQILTLL